MEMSSSDTSFISTQRSLLQADMQRYDRDQSDLGFARVQRKVSSTHLPARRMQVSPSYPERASWPPMQVFVHTTHHSERPRHV